MGIFTSEIHDAVNTSVLLFVYTFSCSTCACNGVRLDYCGFFPVPERSCGSCASPPAGGAAGRRVRLRGAAERTGRRTVSMADIFFTSCFAFHCFGAMA